MAPTTEIHTAGRTAAKGFSWRIIATCTTILIGLLMTVRVGSLYDMRWVFFGVSVAGMGRWQPRRGLAGC